MNILKMMMKSMENRHDRIVTKGVNPSIVSTKEKKNERLDDGTSDIDSLDSFEYTFERRISQLIRFG